MNMSITKNPDHNIIFSRGFTDLLKFIAALLIALGHYASVASEYSNNPVYKVLPMFSGYVGVAIFFLFSGYGLMMSEKRNHLSLYDYLVKRISKVYLPVILVNIVWQVVIWPKGKGLEYVPDALYTIFWGFYDGILWFVKVIIGCYIAFRLYIVVPRRYRIVTLLLLTAALYTIVYLWGGAFYGNFNTLLFAWSTVG